MRVIVGCGGRIEPVPPQNPVDRAIVDVFELRIELTYPMLRLLYALLATARSSLRPRRQLALENLALRQQLAVLRRKSKRPKLTTVDRAFWVALSRLWPDWQSALIVVKPETVIRWHRKREPIDAGKVIALPMVGGLHHRDRRRVA